MFLAAALLMFGVPQSAPRAFAGSSDSTVKSEIVKESAARANALPVAPTPKVVADEAAPTAGESSFVSAEPFLPGAGVQTAGPPKAAMRGGGYEAPREEMGWIGVAGGGQQNTAVDAFL